MLTPLVLLPPMFLCRPKKSYENKRWNNQNPELGPQGKIRKQSFMYRTRRSSFSCPGVRNESKEGRECFPLCIQCCLAYVGRDDGATTGLCVRQRLVVRDFRVSLFTYQLVYELCKRQIADYRTTNAHNAQSAFILRFRYSRTPEPR